MNGGAKQNNALCPFMGEKVDAKAKRNEVQNLLDY